MELILTSFGTSLLSLGKEKNSGLFARMPPLALSQTCATFMPDYPTLLLCDRVVLDAETWDRISSEKPNPIFSEAVEGFRALHAEGFVRIEDFSSIVRDNQDLLRRMLEKDLAWHDGWLGPLRESMEVWDSFVWSMMESLRRAVTNGPHVEVIPPPDTPLGRKASNEHAFVRGLMDGLLPTQHVKSLLAASRGRGRNQLGEELRRVLVPYLAYVNANLVIADKLQTGFHDWCDFAPLYREKFLSIGCETIPESNKTSAVRRLFEISFPEFSYWEAKTLVKALKDRRVRQLRQLVQDAADGKVEFDREFATSVFKEVWRVEQRVTRTRKEEPRRVLR